MHHEHRFLNHEKSRELESALRDATLKKMETMQELVRPPTPLTKPLELGHFPTILTEPLDSLQQHAVVGRRQASFFRVLDGLPGWSTFLLSSPVELHSGLRREFQWLNLE